MSTQAITTRNDIHKSCKTFEAVVNYLNDYSEAVTAIIGIQKKLAKALRDAASTKTTSEVAANALIASATVLDTLCEVDTKFAKLVDSECDSISTEVKKWFKRLAKEERQHDEKVAAAQGKIKQAGQYYERKVKKNPGEAVEEHTRYINLLTTLGQETNQEKLNHSLMVTQRHEATLFSLAACLSRVADAEWLRVCEELRRVSPSIGQVGEWRALCEGNWSGAIPSDLPDVDNFKGPQEEYASSAKRVTTEELASPDALLGTAAPEYASRAVTPTETYQQPPTYFSPTIAAIPEATSTTEHEDTRDRTHSVNSIASLGSFPSPPTHFPLPPVAPINNSDNARQPSSQSSSSTMQPQPQEALTAPETLPTPTAPSPGKTRKDSATFLDFSSPPASPSAASHDILRNSAQTILPSDQTISTSQNKGKEPAIEHDKSRQSDVSSLASDTRSKSYPVSDFVVDAEFGARRISSSASKPGPSTNASTPNTIERSDTSRSNGSIVAAMRDKYSRTTGLASLPQRDVPRLPLSVSNLATRYESPVQTYTPNERVITRSPAHEHVPQSEVRLQAVAPQSASSDSASFPQSYFPDDPASEEIARRRQRIQELEELELREQEYTFRMKEREIQEQARDLERQQLELLQARQNRLQVDTASDRARSQPPMRSRVDSYAEPSTPVQHHPYASSKPGPLSSPSPRYTSQYPSSQPSSPMISQPLRHSTSRDPVSPPRTARPADPVTGIRPDKPKGGWIRRLSMPVMGNAFSESSKKGISNNDVGSQAFYRNSLALPEEDGRLRVDGSKNRSATSLVRR